jgi:hypothetical protein
MVDMKPLNFATPIKPTTAAEKRTLRLQQKQKEMLARNAKAPLIGRPPGESAPCIARKLLRARARFFAYCLLAQSHRPAYVAAAVSREFNFRVTEQSIQRFIDSGYSLQ